MGWSFWLDIATWLFCFFKTFKDPFYGILGYYWLTIMRPQDLHFYTWLGVQRLSFFIALLTILLVFFRRHRLIYRTKVFDLAQNKIYFIFWFGILISYFNSYDPDISWNNFVLLSKMVLFYYVSSYWIETRKQYRVFVWVAIYSMARMSYWANSRYFFDGYFGRIAGPGYGAYGDENVFATLFVIGIPLCYYMMQMVKKKVIKIGLFVVMITFVHCIILTGSRGGFLGMIVGSAEALIKAKKKWISVVIGGLAVILFFQLWGGYGRERQESFLTDSSVRQTSGHSRVEAWHAGLKAFYLNPITGVGLDMFEYIVPLLTKGQTCQVAHNAYIQMLAEAGIFAGGGLIALFVISFIDLWRMRRWAKNKLIDTEAYHYAAMLHSSLMGYGVCAMFLSLDTFEPFYVLVLLIALLKKLVRLGEFSQETGQN